MKLTPELKAEIDARSYEQLLYHWRFHRTGSEMFHGESGEYWRKRMDELRAQPDGDIRHVTASKKIGWDDIK